MNELKHCPFCGSSAQVTTSQFFGGFYAIVRCNFCGGSTTTQLNGKKTKEDAIESAVGVWNRRA